MYDHRPRWTRALAVVALVAAASAAGCSPPRDAGDARAPAETTVAAGAGPRTTGPRAVILVIADGMGFEHLEAARAFRPEAAALLDGFSVRLAVSTYPAGGGYDPAADPADPAANPITDSAAAATAIATGVKTLKGRVGVDPEGRAVETLVETAETLGLSTGLVTSVQFSHATPAAFAAHSNDRHEYADIARQMISESGLDALLGAGHPDFDDDGLPVSGEREYRYVGGPDLWRSVVAGTAGGDADGDGDADPWTLVDTAEGLRPYAEAAKADRLLFVAPVARTLQAERSGPAAARPFETAFAPGVPGLDAMTEAGLRTLQDDPDGLFLLIEAGAVDWASHDNRSDRTLEGLAGLLDALGAVVEWVEDESSWEETLLLVTADHETGGLVAGPPGDDGLPDMEWSTGGHTGALVPLLARGRGAARFATVADETDPLRGDYVDNTEVHAVVLAVLEDEGG